MLVGWLICLGIIATAQVNVSGTPSSLSPFHDGSVIAGCVLSVTVAVLLPLAVLDKATTVGDISKSTAQVAVWMLSIVSLVWAGKIAMELLVRAKTT